MKIKYLIMLLLLIPLATALSSDICEEKLAPGQNCRMLTPSITCTTYNYSIFQYDGLTVTEGNLTSLNNSIYYFQMDEQKGDYIVELCDGSTREIIVGGEDNMGSLAIMFFVLFVVSVLFIFPLIKEFHKNKMIDLILKRCCWILALYLMVLNSAIAATMAEFIGLELTKEMFRYMWIMGWAGYVLMVFTVISTIFSLLKLWKIGKENKRFGEYEGGI